uniref:AMP-dependent synthetase/ligase domain-containing protein n=1 Tax=Aureoumbra lagunensis TaxID=44058 RepID=A0A7S3NP26_9STRA
MLACTLRASSTVSKIAWRRSLSALTNKIDENVARAGEQIVLQYNSIGEGLKWTLKDTKRYASALASGLQEIGFVKGDSIATRLNNDRPEKHVALMAAMINGTYLVSIDPKISDPEKTRSILREHKCKMLIYDEPDIPHLESMAPEFTEHDAVMCKPLIVGGLPHLKYFVTIALDMQIASHNYAYFLAYDRGLRPTESSDGTLAYVDYSADDKRTEFTHSTILDRFVLYILISISSL